MIGQIGDARKRSAWWSFASVFALTVASAPLALVITTALLPMWRWIATEWGVACLTRTGPADWCFLAVYTLCTAAGLAAMREARRVPR
jgi:hypothetical protein